MSHIPHADLDFLVINCAVITISDSRTENTDKSGKIIQDLLIDAGHSILNYTIVKDDPEQILTNLQQLTSNTSLDCLILNGGTGISKRDNTYEVIAPILDKTLPGFGELFRFFSYEEIGSRAIASRAIAGVYKQTLIFSLPGSSNAVKLALNKLILPELIHLIKQLKQD